MFHFIRLTSKLDYKSVLINPAHIIRIEPQSVAIGSEYIRIYHSNGNSVDFLEPSEKVEQLIRQAAFIPEEMFVEAKEVDLHILGIHPKESKPEPTLKHIEEMDHDELVELSSEFIKNGSRFARLEMLFRSFLLKGPSLSEIDRFFTKVRDMGYTFEKAV